MQTLLKKYQDFVPTDKQQKLLNKPLIDQTGFNDGHEDFLKNLIGKLQGGAIDSHKSETLYNHAVYDKLNEEIQEKADLTAINLMSIIRQIESLWKTEKTATFQIQNLVETVFQMKSKFEKEYGDVYII